MANKTITQLDAAQSLNDNMVIAVQDTNTTYKTTLADVKAYCGGGSGNIGIPREVSAQGVYQMPTESFTFSLPSNATDVGDSALSSAFWGCTGLTSVNLSALTTVSGEYGLSSAFYGCSGLTSVDLSALTTVSGEYGLANAFSGCTGLTSVSFPSLTTISGRNGLNNAFRDCTGLTDVYFPALTRTSFGSYKNQFSNMMANTGTTTTHTLHFPLELASTISGLDGYPDFGGTSGYVDCAFEHDFSGGGGGGSSIGR